MNCNQEIDLLCKSLSHLKESSPFHLIIHKGVRKYLKSC